MNDSSILTPQKMASGGLYASPNQRGSILNSVNNGYVSHGQTSDAGSARLSNVNTFKYNGPNVRKVSPSGIVHGTVDYSSGGENKILPSI